MNNYDKRIICPNFQYVFHAELQIHLNWNFTNAWERWFLYFEPISLPPGWNYNPNLDTSQSVQAFRFPPDKLIIYHNVKVKYRCLNCRHEWTSARGRAIFQTEVPQLNKYNFLFAHLSTQQCRYCNREIQPSWYLKESTRVMKNICRILIEEFYSGRGFSLPRPSSPSSSSTSSEENHQRKSQTKGHHYRNLCPACRQGCCFGSHRHRY